MKESAGNRGRPGSACEPVPHERPEPPASSSQAATEAGSQRPAPGEARYQLTVAERAKAAASAGAHARPYALLALVWNGRAACGVCVTRSLSLLILKDCMACCILCLRQLWWLDQCKACHREMQWYYLMLWCDWHACPKGSSCCFYGRRQEGGRGSEEAQLAGRAAGKERQGPAAEEEASARRGGRGRH